MTCHIRAHSVRTSRVGIRASLVPARAMVQPPPPPSPEAVGAISKVAITVAAELTTHVAVPIHASPLQPEKTDPASGIAIRVTVVPGLNDALQVGPQLMVDGL